MSNGRIEGKISIVTGSTAGIGKETAIRLAEEGATVVITGRRQEKGEKVVEEIINSGGKAVYKYLDVLDAESIQTLIEDVKNEFGRIDILVNNVGHTHPGYVENLTLEDWEYTVNMIGRSVFLGCKYVLPIMKEQRSGSIINVTSLAAYTSTPGNSLYGYNKAGVSRFTKTLALECADYGIRCNEVGPPLTESENISGVHAEELFERFKDRMPLGRLAKGRDIANAILFLVSDEASYITGEAIYVTGGATHYMY